MLFMALAGLFFFVAVTKLGIPVILDDLIVPPSDWQDAMFGYSWRVKWGYWLMIPVFAAGLFAIRRKPLPAKWPWLLVLPLLWLGWQFVAASGTVSPPLTRQTLAHFSACVGFFYLGFFALRGIGNPWPVWAGLALALCWVLHGAMVQHFGGLEATRKWFQETKGIYLPAEMRANPESMKTYLARLNSDRVSGTFMYPNALAGGILLLLPASLVFLWRAAPKLRASLRWLFVVMFGGCGMACLYWSGSKAAWLIMVLLGVIALVRLPMRMALKRFLVYGLLVVGLAGFTVKYVQSAERGKTSMVARIVYWKAAIQTARDHPLIGTGPGTFAVAYGRIKTKDSEMARLAHNDFIEQASDSGIIGFLTYAGLITASIYYAYRYRISKIGVNQTIRFAVFLGLLGLFLHSLMEFHLYYPALAWPAFLLLGWLLGQNDE
jgi:O-antigen ligase